MPITRLSRLALLLAVGTTLVSPWPGLAASTETTKPVFQAPPLRTQSLSGAYLAAKSAQVDGDLDAATDYYAQALEIDPTSEMLQQDAMFAFLAAGRFDEGVALATKLRDSSEAGKVARIALGIENIRREQFPAATSQFDIVNPSDLDALLLSHLSAWADAGDKKYAEALERIAELDTVEWYPIFNNYQAGLIATLAGETDKARGFFVSVIADEANAQTSPDAFLAAAEALARLESGAGKRDAALEALGKGLALAESYDPLNHLKERIEKGEALKPAIATVEQGAAEALYILGQAINRGDGQQVAILYFQLARALEPKAPNLLTALAGIAERSKRLDDAIAYYAEIPEDSAFRRTAELQMGLDLWYAERKDEAKQHLRKAVTDYPDDLQAYLAFADVLAADKSYGEAADMLNKAVDLAVRTKEETWNIYYQRGIAHERLKEWEKAEPDFRKALELSPNQPNVLNYLGYSWIDMDRNLDEGLTMIKTAVDLRPNDGYIIDSLGWAYYRLARFDEAVEQLERAVLINPVDPTINDHLGDAYWRVGREREARFQWSRALSGDPKPEAAEVVKIEAKLKEGLPADTRKAEMPMDGPTKADAPSTDAQAENRPVPMPVPEVAPN
ncbi:MAG: tetratricopeptide repeat protein [Rhizobiaceae bacterium]|nr:tetratricopeptide repeat protein [Rhizobiaceae bacterium]